MIIGSNREEYINILNNSKIDAACKSCSKVIWYPNTKATLVDGKLKFIVATHRTLKKIGENTYFLSMCYDCLSIKYPEILHKNPAKLFNTCGEYVKTAFYVTEADFIIQKAKHGITKNSMILKYGKKIGESKWNEYIEAQRITNTFEYKSNKYGITKEEFDGFNKSRACTRDNFHKRYGSELGEDRWIKYCNRQGYTNTLEYFIEKHGEELGYKKYLELNKNKSHTLDNYIKRLGYDIGTSEFKNYINSKKSAYSKVSQSFFKELEKELNIYNFTTYFGNKNGEFGKILKTLNKYCKLDFYIKELKLNIEYFGDYWHANPRIYQETDILHSNLTAKEIWNKDKARIDALFGEHNIQTIVVWQRDDYNNRSNLIKTLLDEIASKL